MLRDARSPSITCLPALLCSKTLDCKRRLAAEGRPHANMSSVTNKSLWHRWIGTLHLINMTLTIDGCYCSLFLLVFCQTEASRKRPIVVTKKVSPLIISAILLILFSVNSLKIQSLASNLPALLLMGQCESSSDNYFCKLFVDSATQSVLFLRYRNWKGCSLSFEDNYLIKLCVMYSVHCLQLILKNHFFMNKICNKFRLGRPYISI